MAEQHVLDLPLPEHTGGIETIFVNAHCQIQSVEGQRLVAVRGLPIHRFAVDDPVARDYAMVLIVEAGHAQQNEVAAAFGCDVRTVRRHQQRYAEGGMAALATRSGWRPGKRRISRTRASTIRRLNEQGDSNRVIARKLGIDEKAVRKQVGPSTRHTQVGLLEDSPLPEPPVETDDTPESAEHSAEDQDWSFGLSADTDSTDRTMDRVLAKLGMLDDAPPLFGNTSAVPGAGVLVALPFLVQSGIFQVSKKLYGSIGPAFYGLRTSLLTLLLMALWRIKRPEWLKERDPAMLGRVLGLDRAPEVKTLRRKLTRLAALGQAERLGKELARLRVEQRGRAMGFLYVDGHVRVYHGKRTLPKAHVARMRLALPATTDYWVNDKNGDPLLVITAEANAGLVKMLPLLTKEIRALVGERKVTIVFDRGGWSPKLFQSLMEQGFDILTYRKGKSKAIAEKCFERRRAKLDGYWVTYLLHDKAVRFLGGKLRLRQVTRLSDDGHQTQVITSRWDLRDIEVAHRMFERWRQENYFKYMREEFLLDALTDYQIEPDDPTRTVPNPARRAQDKKIRAAKAEVTKLEQEFGAAAMDNPETDRPTMRGFKIAHGKIGKRLRTARELLETLYAERRGLPARVEVRETSDDAIIKLACERQHLTSIIKMVAYQAESDLLALLQPHYSRATQEGRTLIHEVLAAPADLKVTKDELRVTLGPLSAPHRTLAIQRICDALNEACIDFPGTRKRLRYVVATPRHRGMAFPGPSHPQAPDQG